MKVDNQNERYFIVIKTKKITCGLACLKKGQYSTYITIQNKD